MLGRFIGAAFIIPGLYFASRGYMTKKVTWQTFGISAMLGFQVCME
jgi:cytochrome c oxidase assembly protein subunit 15